MAVVGSGMQHIAVYGYGCGLNRKPPSLLTFRIHCSSDSKPTRGFGPQPPQRDKKVPVCYYYTLINVCPQRKSEAIIARDSIFLFFSFVFFLHFLVNQTEPAELY